MGLISLPIMLRYGYERPLASGVIAASGTLAQIIPPSLVLIVLADQLGRSVGDMYAGALIPGLLLTGLYCAYIFVVSIVKPSAVPALPAEVRTLGGGVTSLIVALSAAVAIGFAANYLLQDEIENGAAIWAATIAVAVIYGGALLDKMLGFGVLSRLAQQVIIVLIPPLALIFLVLGTIFLGIATPTEGGAMGATGALILAFAKRRLDFKIMSDALEATTRLACFVLFILIGSRIFSLTFYGINGHIWVEELFIALPGGEWGFLVAVNILVFILGCFIDFFEIAFIVVPLLAPVADKFGIDLVWFGIVLAVNLQTSFLTPPFGFALFYMRSVAPAAPWFDKVSKRTIAGVSTLQIYRGAVSFIVLQSIMIVVVLAFPQLSIAARGPEVDLKNIQIELPPAEGEDNGIAPPPDLDLSQPPDLGGEQQQQQSP
jgi:TRAP-type mannitol/chloroaromatic compound transport system permease large subunit